MSDDGPTTTQHSVYIDYLTAIAIRVTILSPVVRKATTQLHWPNCEIMLGNRLRRWANIIPTKTLQALIIDSTTNIIVNIIISEHLIKTKVLNLRTCNVILDISYGLVYRNVIWPVLINNIPCLAQLYKYTHMAIIKVVIEPWGVRLEFQKTMQKLRTKFPKSFQKN